MKTLARSRFGTTTAVIFGAMLIHAHFAYAFAGETEKSQTHITASDDADDTEIDIDSALEAVKAGKALPLSTLQKTVLSRFDGQIINVEVTRKHHELFYEFKVLRPKGLVTEIEINAMSGKIEEVEND